MESLVSKRLWKTLPVLALTTLPARYLAALGLIALVGLIACHPINERTPMDISQLDWNAMAFTCTTEQNPPVDPEADVWVEQARAYEKQGNPANDAEMVRLYQQAAERGHYKGVLNLARLHVYGTGVPRDEGRAVDLVEQGLQMNAPHAYYLMGVMLKQGIGVRPDKAASLAYFRRAADLGNRYGQRVIGREFLRAFSQRPERSQAFAIAVQMLECSLGQDLAEAGHELGLHYVHAEENIAKGLESFQKAAALGHNESLYWLYATFKDGDYGLAKDPERAACYYQLRSEVLATPGTRFPDIDQICPLSGPVEAASPQDIEPTREEPSPTISDAATIVPNGRTMSLVLGALPGHLFNYAQEPYRLFADGVLLQKGLLDAEGRLQWQHREGTQRYRLELITGQSFEIDVQQQFSEDPDQSGAQRLSDQGYSDHGLDPSGDDPSFRQTHAQSDQSP